MDFSAIIGFVAGTVLIMFGIVDGGGLLKFFYDLPSIAITCGGTLACALISFPISTFKHIPRHMRIIVQRKKYDPKQYIGKIVEYAVEARKQGMLSLEEKANQEKDPFFRNSIMLIVDTVETEKTRELLENELNCLEDRHSKGWSMYEKVATYAPAFGMIGTLIGLVNMLKKLNVQGDDAAEQLGNGMSLALLTTFYGSILANFVLMPIASRLCVRHGEEVLCKEMIVEGVLAIQAGQNPRTIEERLLAFLSDAERLKLSTRAAASAAAAESAKNGSRPGRAGKR